MSEDLGKGVCGKFLNKPQLNRLECGVLRALGVLLEGRWAVTFNDGLSGIVDVSALVHGADAGVFEAPRIPAFLAKACLDCGAISMCQSVELKVKCFAPLWRWVRMSVLSMICIYAYSLDYS